MAILYKNYQDNRKGGTKLFYARAIHPTLVDLDEIAKRIQENCSMTKGDVLAVLTELITVMKYELQNSNQVELGDLGRFYINISTSGTINEESFDINKNLKGAHVKFLAKGKRQAGSVTRTFCGDLSYKKAK